MIVACVRTGTKYGPEYVMRLEAAVARHLRQPYQFVCLTDRPQELPLVTCIDISRHGLDGWWGKMALFEFAAKRRERVVYFDLDTVVVGDLSPLALIGAEFGICGSFTRAAGHLDWPCRYGSCVMTLAPGFGAEIWQAFAAARTDLMMRAGRYGDQWAIELLWPAATILQDCLPEGFFLGYRDLTEARPEGCSLVIFAGRSKPHTCDHQWIVDAWTL
jgi:hypothetical protein